MALVWWGGARGLEGAWRVVGWCCHLPLPSLVPTLPIHTSRYPQIYESDEKLVVDAASVVVARRDFMTALSAITPASHRREWQRGGGLEAASVLVARRDLPSTLTQA